MQDEEILFPIADCNLLIKHKRLEPTEENPTVYL